MPCTTRQAIDPKRSITMEVLDGPGTPEVLGDEPRLRQVLSNLMANALQHTPESADIIVRVGTDGDDAVLEVVDKGPGMSRAGCVAGVRTVLSHRLVAGARPAAAPDWGCRSSTRWCARTVAPSRVTTAPGEGCCFRVSLPRVSDVPAHV